MENYKIIKVSKPKCALSWKGDDAESTFMVFRDFNWFQQKMLKWCFGLKYTKIMED